MHSSGAVEAGDDRDRGEELSRMLEDATFTQHLPFRGSVVLHNLCTTRLQVDRVGKRSAR